MTEIQNELLNMLKEISVFLEENNLEYFLAGGTMLGAVRHNGFIPWDDDIDLFMRREEYEKLIQIGRKNNKVSDGLYISSIEIDGLPKPFIKIINKRIKIIDSQKIDKYLWIDIFPLDSITNDDAKIRKIYKKEHFYKLLLRLKLSNTKWDNSIKGISKKAVRQLLKLINYNYLVKKMINLAKNESEEDSDYMANIVWGYGPCEVVRKELFKAKKVRFEDITLNGIGEYDEYLTSIYGDYMKLPPEEKRVTHEFSIERVQ